MWGGWAGFFAVIVLVEGAAFVWWGAFRLGRWVRDRRRAREGEANRKRWQA